MAIFELIGLNESTPQLVAPTATDVGAITGSLVVGSNSITPTGALHVEGNATINGDLFLGGNSIDLSGAPLDGHITFDGNDTIRIGTDALGLGLAFEAKINDEYNFFIGTAIQLSINQAAVELRGNDLILGGGLIEFDDANTKILQTGSSLHFDIASGTFVFIITAQTRFSVSTTKVSMHGNILDLAGGHIQFNNTNFRITQLSNDIEIDVGVGGAVVFKIDNATEFTVDATTVNIHTKNLRGVLDIEAENYIVGVTPGASFSGAVSNITVINGIVTAAS